MEGKYDGHPSGIEPEEAGRSIVSSFRAAASSFRSFRSSIREEDDDEYELKWAAIERLPTFDRLRTSLFDEYHGDKDGQGARKEKKPIDVTKLGTAERRLFIQNLIKHIQKDNLQLLQKQRERMDRVNVKQPTIEVRYKNLSIQAECQVVPGKPLPTLWNSAMSTISVLARVLGLNRQEAKIQLLKDVNGIIKPSRMTLLLGPPGCGKTTLLLALAGKLDKNLKVTGEIEYNGVKLNEFVPEKTSAYISQYDLHVPFIPLTITFQDVKYYVDAPSN